MNDVGQYLWSHIKNFEISDKLIVDPDSFDFDQVCNIIFNIIIYNICGKLKFQSVKKILYCVELIVLKHVGDKVAEVKNWLSVNFDNLEIILTSGKVNFEDHLILKMQNLTKKTKKNLRFLKIQVCLLRPADF